MPVLNFKLTNKDKVTLEISEPQKLGKLLPVAAQKAGIKLGGFIAIKNGKVITREHLVENGDEINIFPAISGG
ncbi:Sulfur carrier protein ThiS (thiamine biosynthesis) [Desulfocicer vacuolatum DSM 3385]|uniref:Sulfur carrier protein ThiS (Thiamine biosynthesis) n=1 Tax=Desulfocicer vacuolatum DSM 3385 TaxID=1121400 RepID=A0A1W2A211_9BACT|nr:MoaD/ThiS family protein [Desulfocicer vacuolatum]SMC54715.1 Sulfur carrier protein ThiS (thiamine biosynthesis) [Desulfocicer vacuolatum DSM 3385]